MAAYPQKKAKKIKTADELMQEQLSKTRDEKISQQIKSDEAVKNLITNLDVNKTAVIAPSGRKMSLAELQADIAATQADKERPQAPIIYNQETGEPSFVLGANGQYISVAGEKKEVVSDLIEKQQEKQTGLAAAQQNILQAQNFMAQRQAISGLGQQVQPSAQLGQDNLTPGLIRAGIFGGGGAGIATKVLSGVLGGAARGAVGGPGGIAIGAVGGFAVGAGLGIFGAVISDKVKTKSEAVKLFKDSIGRDYSASLNLANQGNSLQAMQNYNTMLANIRESERALTEIVKTSTGRDLTGSVKELYAVRQWLADEFNYRAKLASEIQNPDPKKFYQAPQEVSNE